MDNYNRISNGARSSLLLAAAIGLFCVRFASSATATVPPTSIYIDQIPLYSSLAVCAEDSLSAIVRAQSSGCGDDMQLTSFSCFCLQSSSQFSSIISTAVQSSCLANATATRTRSTTIATQTIVSDISSALEVFHSYCEKSTELPWYADNSTLTQGGTVTMTITSPPQTVTAAASTGSAPAKSSSHKKTNVAAIVAPVVIVVVLAAAAAGIFFFWRRRRNANRTNAQELYAAQGVSGDGGSGAKMVAGGERNELPGDYIDRQEAQGSVKYAYEVPGSEMQRAELDGGVVQGEKSGPGR